MINTSMAKVILVFVRILIPLVQRVAGSGLEVSHSAPPRYNSDDPTPLDRQFQLSGLAAKSGNQGQTLRFPLKTNIQLNKLTQS